MNIKKSASCLLLLFILFAGCLPKRETLVLSSNTGSWFSGANRARNLGGIPSATKVEWSKSERSVAGYRVYALIEDPVTKVNSWVNLQEMTPEANSFIHSNLPSGRIFSYVVRAVGLDGEEDTNNKQVSTVTFSGLSDIKITGPNSAVASLDSSLGAFDEVRIYAAPKSNPSLKKLVGSATGNIQTINLTSLRSGTTYLFYANAYMSYLNAEDGNESYKEAQTHSVSFGNGLVTDKSYTYEGIISAQGFGDAPNAPQDPADLEKMPNVRLLRFSWLPFRNLTTIPKYKVVRTLAGNRLDTTVTTACTASLDVSCVACTVTGSGVQSCTDKNIAAPPKAYEYTVVLMQKNEGGDEWAEELPITKPEQFKIKLHVPPPNMVLVQRDAVNKEMCELLRKPSDVRKKHRCEYYGIGGQPANTGPGGQPLLLDANFYDFGYNLFVDRFKVACNWTRSSSTCPNGQCIDIKTYADTNATNAPSGDQGKENDVFFAINGTVGPNCFIKAKTAGGSTWKPLYDSSLTADDLRIATTIDPGPPGQRHRPPINHFNPQEALRVCQAQTTPYGRVKRLFRRREWIAASPLPWMNGEPYAITDPIERNNIQRGVLNFTEGPCAANMTPSLLPPRFRTGTVQGDLDKMLEPNNAVVAPISDNSNWNLANNSHYYIGHPHANRCISRFGMHDYFVRGYMGHYFSDMFSNTKPGTYPMVLEPMPSTLEPGHNDMGAYRFDGTIGFRPSEWNKNDWYSMWIWGRDKMANTHMILPLGLLAQNWLVGRQDMIPMPALSASGHTGTIDIAGNINPDLIRTMNTADPQFYLMGGGHVTTGPEGSNNGRFSYGIIPGWRFGEISLMCVSEAE